MNQTAAYLAAAVAAYLVGSVPFGFWIARARGVDLRAVGSGNIGAANVSRALGRYWGTIVLMLDLLKGFVPTCGVMLGQVHLRERGLLPVLMGVVVGLGCILGHNFTIFLKFRGGKGVATSAGVFLVLAAEALFVSLAVYVLARVVFKYFSLASILAAASLPVAAIWIPKWITWGDPMKWEGGLPVVCFSVLAAGMVIARHHQNIRRLIAGTEPNVSSKGSRN